MKQIFNLSAPLLVAVSLLVAGAAPDSSAVEILIRIARRVEGIDHSATLTIEKFSRGKLTATQRMDFFVRYPAADSVIMQTAIELLPGSRGAGQKFWLWQLTHDRKRQWLYSPGSDKLREITRRKGRAPNAGSNPCSAKSSFAFSVTSMVIPLTETRKATLANSSSTIFLISSFAK